MRNSGASTTRQRGIDHDDEISGLREWVDVAHVCGSKLVAQLNHGGRLIARLAAGADRIVSASNGREPLYGTKPPQLRLDEMAGIVDTLLAASVRAREAGFDGVQTPAHGCLLSQFVTVHTNRRSAEYGSSLAGRGSRPTWCKRYGHRAAIATPFW